LGIVLDHTICASNQQNKSVTQLSGNDTIESRRRHATKKGCWETRTSSRESLQLAVDEER